MRSILTAVFVAALVAVPAQSNAAPRSIDDCEKIQAADAYNHCLALFGPLARGHGTAGDGVDADRQDAAAATGNAHAGAVTGRDSHHGRHHASRHGWTRHSWARAWPSGAEPAPPDVGMAEPQAWRSAWFRAARGYARASISLTRVCLSGACGSGTKRRRIRTRP